MIETTSAPGNPGATKSVANDGPAFELPAELKDKTTAATDSQDAKPEDQKAQDPASPEAAKTDETSSETSSPDKDKQDKPPSRLQQRIDELTRDKRSAERRANEARAEVQRLNARLQERMSKIDPNDYQANDDFRVERVVKSGQIEVANDEAQRQSQQAADSRREVFAAKIDAARESDAGLDQKLAAFANVPVTDFGASFIAESPVAVEIATHLGAHPAEAARIARLPEGQQGIELARLEAKLRTPPARKITQAPQPVPTLGGSRSPAIKDPADMSVAELSGLIYRKG